MPWLETRGACCPKEGGIYVSEAFLQDSLIKTTLGNSKSPMDGNRIIANAKCRTICGLIGAYVFERHPFVYNEA